MRFKFEFVQYSSNTKSFIIDIKILVDDEKTVDFRLLIYISIKMSYKNCPRVFLQNKSYNGKESITFYNIVYQLITNNSFHDNKLYEWNISNNQIISYNTCRYKKLKVYYLWIGFVFGH